MRRLRDMSGAVVIMLMTAALMTGCEQGPAEQVGEKVDEVIRGEGPAEKAGERIDDAADKVGERVDDATSSVTGN